jgi:hypothetical protein
VTAKQGAGSEAVGEILRPLSAHERLFWAIDRVNIFNFSVAVTIRGTVAHERWTRALAQVQKRHPLLNACVSIRNAETGQDDPHAPAFVQGEGQPISIAFRPRSSVDEWRWVMEAEHLEPFDASVAPFLRAVLLEDSEGCDLILTANHVVLDGMGMVGLIRELLTALAGKRLAPLSEAMPGPLSAPPSADERTARMSSADAVSGAAVQAGAAVAEAKVRASKRRIGDGKPPTVSALRLSKQMSAELLRCSRKHEATVGSVLLAALARALQELSPELRTSEVRFVAPVDVRPHLANEGDFVLSFINARGVVPHQAVGLWESARAIRAQLVPYQSFAAIEMVFNAVKGAMSQNLEPITLVDYLAGAYGHDLILTNLKSVEFETVPGGMSVEAVWGPSVLGRLEGEHVVGAVTFAGVLHLVYTSHSPVAGLLERVRKMIGDACAKA